MTQITAVASQKGGVGKTTTVINLGTALAKMGKRTLLVDLDPQNGLMLGAGLESFASDPGLFSLVESGGDFESMRIELETDGLDVLLAGPVTAGLLDRVQRVLTEQPSRFAEIMGAVAGAYDIVLLDCPAGIGPVTTAALCAADDVLIPMQCHPLSLRTLPVFLEMILHMRTTLNPRLTLNGVLLTMYDARLEAQERVAEQVWSALPSRVVFDTTIPRHDSLIRDFSGLGPVTQNQPQTPGAQAYMQLAREIVGRLSEKTAPASATAGVASAA